MAEVTSVVDKARSVKMISGARWSSKMQSKPVPANSSTSARRQHKCVNMPLAWVNGNSHSDINWSLRLFILPVHKDIFSGTFPECADRSPPDPSYVISLKRSYVSRHFEIYFKISRGSMPPNLQRVEGSWRLLRYINRLTYFTYSSNKYCSSLRRSQVCNSEPWAVEHGLSKTCLDRRRDSTDGRRCQQCWPVVCPGV